MMSSLIVIMILAAFYVLWDLCFGTSIWLISLFQDGFNPVCSWHSLMLALQFSVLICLIVSWSDILQCHWDYLQQLWSNHASLYSGMHKWKYSAWCCYKCIFTSFMKRLPLLGWISQHTRYVVISIDQILWFLNGSMK
jgi:hypothetical protein